MDTPVWVKNVASGPRVWSPAVFFVFDLLVFALLLFVGPFNVHSWSIFQNFHNPIPTVLPSVVPWAGAVGGVCISLVGVAGHAMKPDWQPSRYGYWHLTRPLLGAIFGSTAVLIVTLITQNVKGADVSTKGFTPSGAAILAVIAFVVGFREETFRTLVMRVVDLVIGPSSTDTTAQIAFVPTVVEFTDVTVGDHAVATTHLFNGSQDTIHIAAGSFTVDNNDIAIAPAKAADVDLSPGESLPINLTWTPVAPANMIATLSVKLATTPPKCALSGRSTR